MIGQMRGVAILYGALLAVPLIWPDNAFLMHILIMGFLWTMVAASWDVLLGYAGIVSYGQMALFAVGAYTTGILSSQYEVAPLLGVGAGGVAAALLAAGIGLVALRLSVIYFALVTFAVHLTLAPMLVAGREIGTGGSQGIWMIPSIDLGPLTLGPADTVAWYYTAWMLAALTVIAIHRLITSSLGDAFTALRDSSVFAQSIGIHAFRYRLIVLVGCGALAGLAGAFYAHYVSSVSPKILGLDTFLMVFGMMIIGGIGRFPGVVWSALLVTVASELLRDTGYWRLIGFGALVILAVLYLRGGLAGALHRVGLRVAAPLRRSGAGGDGGMNGTQSNGHSHDRREQS